jgi:hypothetical protein
MDWGWNTGVRSAQTMCTWDGKRLVKRCLCVEMIDTNLSQEKFRTALPRIETCIRYASPRLAQYQAFPRDYQN